MRKSKSSNGKVKHPSHYRAGKFECIDVIEALGLNYNTASAFAYIFRHKKKGGMEDLKKAIFYLEREVNTNDKPD